VDRLLLRSDVGIGARRGSLWPTPVEARRGRHRGGSARLSEVTQLVPDSVETRAAERAAAASHAGLGRGDRRARGVHERLLRLGAQGAGPGFEATLLSRSIELAARWTHEHFARRVLVLRIPHS